MNYVDSKLLAQSRFKTKLSNQLIIAMLSNEDLNKMMMKQKMRDIKSLSMNQLKEILKF